MQIAGIQKLSLLDYQNTLACVVFLPGCNLRCPFCHNATLVTGAPTTISEEQVFEFLRSRVGVLEGVCISGGEPTLQKELPEFIAKIKELGFKIKLDTNGTAPETLQYLIDNYLVDYVAMDIKTSLQRYSAAVGVSQFTADKVEKSIMILLNSDTDYEFRTTVARGIVSLEDIDSICESINGCKAYYLQKFIDSGNLVGHGDFEVSDLYMISCLDRARNKLNNVQIRGVDLHGS